MKISVAIQILPTTAEGTSESVVQVVDKVIEYIQSQEVDYVVTPFETVIELDDFDKAFEILKNCVKLAGEHPVISGQREFSGQQIVTY